MLVICVVCAMLHPARLQVERDPELEYFHDAIVLGWGCEDLGRHHGHGIVVWPYCEVDGPHLHEV